MSNSDKIVNKALVGVFKANDRSIDHVKRQLGVGIKKSSKKKRNLADIVLSTTVILVEVAASDESFQLSEYDTISEGLRQLYGTGREEAKKYINQALIFRSSLSGNSRHLELLRDNLSEQEKLRVVRIIDDIISVDGHEDPYEIFLRQRYRRALGLSDKEASDSTEESAIAEAIQESEEATTSESDLDCEESIDSGAENTSENNGEDDKTNQELSEPDSKELKAESTKTPAREHHLDRLSKRIDDELY